LEIQGTEPKLCSKCNAVMPVERNYCSHCGQAQNYKEVKFYGDKKQNLILIALFFAIEIIVCVASLLIEEQTLTISMFLDLILAITAVLFFCYNWDENKFLLKWPNFSILKLLGLILLTITGSFIVQFLSPYINQFIFNKNYTSYYAYAFLPYGNYIMIATVALCPALFEELAYRGFLMQRLLNIVDAKEAIYISSILFFFIHFSMISFFWLLPFALLLGYIRIKTNTIWYGVVLHFFFNLISCLVEMYNFDGFNF
jgi:membrane protease YdiL (CAAX protease family)